MNAAPNAIWANWLAVELGCLTPFDLGPKRSSIEGKANGSHCQRWLGQKAPLWPGSPPLHAPPTPPIGLPRVLVA